jgi:ubiquinone/menaquinone biosynthesis C-methylase UbiE
MDLPDQDEKALRSDLENIAGLNRTFGGTQAVEKVFRELAGDERHLTLIDLAAGYGDHGRNLIARAREQNCDLTVIASDIQFQTLKIAREATPPGTKMLFVQADARQLPFRSRAAELTFCSLALHHFSDEDAASVLREMARVARQGLACVDLARSRLGVIGIWLLTTFIVRDPMVRHDGRISSRRAFSLAEMKSLAQKAGWINLRQIKFRWFQQAILSRIPK